MPGSCFPGTPAVGVSRAGSTALPECCSGLGASPSTASPRAERAEGTRLLLRDMGSEGQLAWQEAAVVGDRDLSRLSDSEPLSPVLSYLPVPRCTPASQPICRAPSSPDTHGETVPGGGHGAGWRVELLPLLAFAFGPSLQPSSFTRCRLCCVQLSGSVQRGKRIHAVHPGFSKELGKGNHGHFHGSCPCIS